MSIRNPRGFRFRIVHYLALSFILMNPGIWSRKIYAPMHPDSMIRVFILFYLDLSWFSQFWSACSSLCTESCKAWRSPGIDTDTNKMRTTSSHIRIGIGVTPWCNYGNFICTHIDLYAGKIDLYAGKNDVKSITMQDYTTDPFFSDGCVHSSFRRGKAENIRLQLSWHRTCVLII